MLTDSLRQRLKAAGLPTDPEGVLEAAVRHLAPDAGLFIKVGSPEVGEWLVTSYGHGMMAVGPVGAGASVVDAVARWLLAVKEAKHG